MLKQTIIIIMDKVDLECFHGSTGYGYSSQRSLRTLEGGMKTSKMDMSERVRRRNNQYYPTNSCAHEVDDVPISFYVIGDFLILSIM